MDVNYDTGITQYLKFGTGATATTYAGRVTGGRLYSDPQRVWRPSVGGTHGVGRGIWRGGGTATIEIYDQGESTGLLTYYKRASFTKPSLTALTFEGGVTTANQAFTQSTCYIASMEANLAVGDPLTATIEWVATSQAAQATPSGPTQSANHWEWFQGQCAFAGSTYHLQRASIRVENSLEPLSSIESKTYLIQPEGFKVGTEKVTASFEMLEFPGTTYWLLDANTDPAVTTLVISCVNGGDYLTFTMNNLRVDTMEMAYQNDDGTVVWAVTASATPNASNSLAVTCSVA